MLLVLEGPLRGRSAVLDCIIEQALGKLKVFGWNTWFNLATFILRVIEFSACVRLIVQVALQGGGVVVLVDGWHVRGLRPGNRFHLGFVCLLEIGRAHV